VNEGIFADNFTKEVDLGVLLIEPFLTSTVLGGIFLFDLHKLGSQFTEAHARSAARIKLLIEKRMPMVIVDAGEASLVKF
jgi:hypothetical protein